MDGLFACPECGSDVEVGGLAPGRQVRCGFCQRLLEVPYLPHGRAIVEAPTFQVTEMGCVGMGRAGRMLVVVVAAGAVQFLRRQYDSIQDRSINQLLASSHQSRGRRAPG